MANFESFRTLVVPSRRLTAPQVRDINRLKEESLALDFSFVPEERRRKYVNDRKKTVKHPNKGVGRGDILDNQAYARAISVMVLNAENDELMAHATVADNASKPSEEDLPDFLSKTAVEIARTGIMQAKLRMPFGSFNGKPFIGSRYLWWGYVPLSMEARRNVLDADPDVFNAVDHVLLAGMRGRHDEQKLSIYPYGPERVLKPGLDKAGLVSDPDYHTKTVAPFGPAWPFDQEHWIGGTVVEATARLLEKSGAPAPGDHTV